MRNLACFLRTTWTWWAYRRCFLVWRFSLFKAARWTCWRGLRWTVTFQLHSSIPRRSKNGLFLLRTRDTFILNASCVEYLFHVAKLNQLLVLSQQLEEDIRHLGSHKYITHQLSVIYVSKHLYTALCRLLYLHSIVNLVFCLLWAASTLLFQRKSDTL